MLAAESASESGISLIEVVISALIVGIIAIATLTGFESAGHATADERSHNQATLIATQDQERQRGLASSKLSQFGRETYTVSETGLRCSEHVAACEKGEVYTVESSSEYVSANYKSEGSKEEDTLTCSTSEGEASFVKTTSVVSWTEFSKARKLEQSSIISTPSSSALEVKVFNQAKQPLAGAVVTAKGTTTNVTQTTPSTGCVVLGGISDKTVEISASKAGFVGHEGETPAPKSATPATGGLKAEEIVLAEAGSITATFATNGTTTAGVTSDTVYVGQAGVGTPSYFVAGTAGTPASSATMSNLFPFTSPSTYTVFAGDCEKNNPETVASVKPASAQVEPGQNASVLVEVPKLNWVIWGGTGSGAPGSKVTSLSAKLTNTECASKSAQNYTTVPYEHTVKVTNGSIEPAYFPYAKAVKLCVVFKEGTSYYKYESSQVNNLKAGTAATALYGRTTGSVTTVTATTKC